MLIGLASWLTSCVVGEKYTRIDVNAPTNYRSEVSITADTIVLPWKTFFKDPILVSLIDKALTKNNEVVVALKTIDQLELSRRQARLALLPTVGGTTGIYRNYTSLNSLNGSLTEQFSGTKYIDDFSTSLTISWEADIWGKAKMQQEQARANYFAQKYNLLALKTRIISQVTQAYFNLVSLDAQLRIAHQNIALLDSTIEIIKHQYNSGMSTSVAVEQAVAQKNTAELIIPLALQNIVIQESELSILCGEYPDSIKRAKDIEGAALVDTFSVGVPAQLISRRPDIAAA
ncbi:TolC family protein, partial [Flectobacillus sp. BAB-3569]|uniref:TolC family protein n=1 Tax=Flectobacillus sp. BAB-3569 TaxID=1509483 RepID=UPI0015956A04